MFLVAPVLPKILPVDDQTTVIHQLNNIVKDIGEACFASNGRSALDMVQRHRLDLDIEMSDLNGYDVPEPGSV